MIVLDASVVIACLDAHDTHHRRAVALLEPAADDELAMGALTLAEVLVAPARAGRLDDVHVSLAELGVMEQPLPHGSAVRLAVLRARTGLRMPDCCAILAAVEASAARHVRRSTGSRGRRCREVLRSRSPKTGDGRVAAANCPRSGVDRSYEPAEGDG